MEKKKKKKACVCVSIYFSSSYHFLQWKFSKSTFVFFLLEYCLHSRSKSSSNAIPAVSDGRKGEFLTLERLWHSELPASPWLQLFSKHVRNVTAGEAERFSKSHEAPGDVKENIPPLKPPMEQQEEHSSAASTQLSLVEMCL